MAHKKNTRFGIQTPPLLNYLQRILRGYSDGQILKELLQNAEDAGASEIHFLYDQHQYGREHLLDSRLGIFQGPALCSYNNAVFKEGDWDAIQRPEQSGKKEDVLKVGRFGIGFSSVYHLTDFPCIMSQNSLAMIDPFQKYFDDEEGIRQSGSKWELSEITRNQSYKDQLQPFRNAFPTKKRSKKGVFPATVFRFPLRTAPSRLCESVYTPQKTKELLGAFKDDAKIVLLFLRKIETVKILCQESTTSGQQTFLEVSIERGSVGELRKNRELFNAELAKYKENPSAFSKNITMTNTFTIVTTNGENCSPEKWLVHQEIAIRCNDRLKHLFERLKFLPWVGVAVPLFQQEASSGRTFCFLPLPAGDESLSGLPVHVHGFFGVSDDRRSIKWPSLDKVQNEQADWNKLLVDEILPKVYMKALTESSQIHDIDPDIVYAAFPDASGNLGHWTKAVETLYGKLFEHPMLYCQTKNKWMLIKDVIIAPNELAKSPEEEQLLVDILAAHGHAIVTDLPIHIRYAIDKFASPQYISPGLVLRCLRNEQPREFSDEETLCLLGYLLRNNCSAEDLDGLPLLPVDSGEFSEVSADPDSSEMVYIATENCPQKLLPNLQHRFLRRNIHGKLAMQLHDMCSSDAWRQLKFLDVGVVLDLLPDALPKILRTSSDAVVTWHPKPTDAYNTEWLEHLWSFLVRNLVDLDKVMGLKVIPVDMMRGKRVQMATVSRQSKIIRRPATNRKKHKNDDIIVNILVELGVTLCTIPQYVDMHYQMAHSNYVLKFAPNDILSLLQRIGSSEIENKCYTKHRTHEQFLYALLPYLLGAVFSENDKQFIKSLVIFPQFHSEVAFALYNVHAMINTKTKNNLPSIGTFGYVCIHVKSDDLLLVLKKLGMEENTSETLLMRMLGDASKNKYTDDDMQVLLKWVKSRYKTIKTWPGICKILKEIEFVPNEADELRKPKELFDRSDDLIKRLALDGRLLPNEDFFRSWGDLLIDLGLKPKQEMPSSQLLNIAENIRVGEDQEQASALVELIQRFPQYLSDGNLCQFLKYIPILSCRVKPPKGYPPNFEFRGRSMFLSKPVESLVFSNRMCSLVGASVPLVDNLTNEVFLKRLGIKQCPPVEDVLRQLNFCVSQPVIHASHRTMLRNIYEFLNDKIGCDAETDCKILEGLPERWIYLGDKFMETKRVYTEETSGAIDLRPFRSPIPLELKQYDKLLSAAGVSKQVNKSADLFIDVLKEIKQCNEMSSNERVGVAMNILRRLAYMGGKDYFKKNVLIPTSGELQFLPPDQVYYYDADWLKQGEEADDFDMEEDEDAIHIVHDDISPALAEKLGVMPLSQRLADANQIGDIMQTGQCEPLTVRLKNILRDGYQPESIAKEMVQNAEDAGATSVKFLLDLRTNSGSMEKLLDPEMSKVQGPALWVYNDAVFSDDDLQNITKLGGATKSEDGSKIGQFGLGFNAVYHITDVPSFVTRNFITFFDPHRAFLKCHIRGAGSGIRLDFTNPSRVRRFRHQFEPYDGIFGCKLLGNDSTPETFNGTLFRLPLRSKACAYDSKICEKSYSEKNMKPLMKSLCETSSQLILFTEKVQSVSVSLFEDGSPNANTLHVVNRECMGNLSFKDKVRLSMKEKHPLPQDTVSQITLSSKWTAKGKKYFRLPTTTKNRKETWLKVSSAGKGKSRELCETEIGSTSGLLPCGGVAWCSNGQIRGNIFCHLPLSVPDSGLPVCINGSFTIGSDRRSLWRETNSMNSEDAEFRVKWNHALCEDVVVSAYITLLVQLQVTDFVAKNRQDCFSLWPNPDNTSQRSDCGKVMTGFYHAVANGMPGMPPPSIFYENGSTNLTIEEVVFVDQDIQGTEILNVFEQIVLQTTHKVALKLPPWVKRGFEESGSKSVLAKCIYSWCRFFREIFLPNLGCLEEGEICSMVKFALNLRDPEILEMLKNSQCIQNDSDRELTYKKPSDLLDPKVFKDIYPGGEGFFPASAFLNDLNVHQIETLREVGCMSTDVDWPIIVERAKTVNKLWKTKKQNAKSRSKAILHFLNEKLKSRKAKIDREQQNALNSVMFLLARKGDKGESLQCAKDVYSCEQRDLIGRVCYCLIDKIPPLVGDLMAIRGKEVLPEDVINNMHEVQRCCGRIASDKLHQQIMTVYHYLESHIRDNSVLHFVRTGKCFLVEETFVEAEKLALESESIPPFLYKVPYVIRKKFQSLLDSANVRECFGYIDFIGVLQSLMQKLNGKPLDNATLRSILTKIIQPLYDVAEEIPHELVKKIPLPDAHRVLRYSGSLSFCDLDQFEHLTRTYHVCHSQISSTHAKRLGVKDIREQMLSKYSHCLPGYTEGTIGESFGQREELVTRITRIMEGYPGDFSILKEIVQNADDAKASKVHFVLDYKERPIDRLFYDTMKDLQGPALLTYNNRPFSDDDIKGIQKLGLGSKGDDASKTGRYGVGFNVVYHLTDCPMFLSNGDTLCIFDPTLQYVKDASVASPGRMYRPVNDEMLESYKDIFDCFFSYKSVFSLEGGSLFRFPLRKTKSELGSKISVKDVEALFRDFKNEIFDSLLFLKYVREITISSTNGKGDTMEATYTVKLEIPDLQSRLALERFHVCLSEGADILLSEVNEQMVQFSVTIGDNCGYSEDWLVHQRIGIQNKGNIPPSVKHANARLRLVPKGGVAAKLASSRGRRSSTKNRKFGGKCFCFLPLPNETNLPVHVDGYFALDHECRRSIWEAPHGDPRGDWNLLLAREVIAPAYVSVIDKIKARVTRVIQSGTNKTKTRKLLQEYHILFPDFSPPQNVKLTPLDVICESFYLQVLNSKLQVFPVFLNDCPFFKENQSGHVMSSETTVPLLWKSCIADSHEKGYFDDLTQQKRMGAVRAENVRKLLLKIGFPILETPLRIFDIVKRLATNSAVLTVSANSVLQFLRTDARETTISKLPMKLQDTLIGDTKHLHLLTEFIMPAITQLEGLPLLLTNDDTLRNFTQSNRVFHSEYYSLLPSCGNEFLHSEFVSKLEKTDNCFKHFEVTDLVERLSTYIPRNDFYQVNYKQWEPPFVNPSKDWLVTLWKFLGQSKETGVSLRDTFRDWCIFPAQIGDQLFLVPLSSSKTVLSSKPSSYHADVINALQRLNAPIAYIEGIETTLHAFVNSFASNIDSVGEILKVFERLVRVSRDAFRDLGNKDHSCILHYFSVNKLTDSEISILKKLPCFETIQGEYVDLSKASYAVSMEGIPESDLDKWVPMCRFVLLRKESVPAGMLESLSIRDFREIDVYRDFILPFFQTFSKKGRWDHLTKIMYMVDNSNDAIVDDLKLKSRPIIPLKDGSLKKAMYFRDDENPVYKEMSEDKYFPPKHPDQRKQAAWRRFLRKIGIQVDVDCLQFQEFLQRISSDARCSRKREQIMVEYLAVSHHLHGHSFLARIALIPFITAHKVSSDLCKLHKQSPKSKVSISSVSGQYERLVWTTEALLPSWVCLRMCGSCDQNDNKILSTTKEPTMEQVLAHTVRLFQALSSTNKISKGSLPPMVRLENLLIKVITEILCFLSEKCEKSETGKRCSEKAECCDTCRTIVQELQNQRIVPVGQGVFFQVKKMTKHLPERENDKLFHFLRELPEFLMAHSDILYCMGLTRSPSITQYAGALELMAKDKNFSRNPPLQEASVQAMEGFLRCLSQVKEFHLGDIAELYLLTSDTKKPILESKALFYNDKPVFEQRLSHFPGPQIRNVPFLEKQAEADIAKWFSKLGPLAPKLISDYVREVPMPFTPKPCRCDLSSQVRLVLSSPLFSVALKSIVVHNKLELAAYENIFDTSYQVKCTSKIETKLQFQGDDITASIKDVGVRLERENDNVVIVYLSHDHIDCLIHDQIAERFISFFSNFIRDMRHLAVVLKSKSEDDILGNLKELGIKTSSPKRKPQLPLPGSPIEEDVVCLLEESFLFDFNPGEYVGYNFAQSEDAKFVYAKIIKRIDEHPAESTTFSAYRVKYAIDIGSEKEVDAMWLYKFPRPDELPPYDPNGPASSSKALEVYEGECSESFVSEDDFSDLAETKRKVTKLIEDLWKEGTALRNAGLRRLMRHWHPDKCKPEHKQFAEEIFKHIRRVITRLEKGKPSGVDTDEDVNTWARQNSYNRSRYWRNHSRRFGGNRSRGSGNRGSNRYYNTNYHFSRGFYGRNFYCPPSFHQDNQEALKWLNQARVDVKAASALVNAMDMHFHQWKSQLCFFAAYKSIRAAQLVSGCQRNRNHSIVEAADRLRRHLDIITEAHELDQIVNSDSHYPDSSSGPIPHRLFTYAKAQSSMTIAKEIIAKVEEYVNDI